MIPIRWLQWNHGRHHALCASRGFLGLASYYRKFITRYGDVARPLTARMKRDAFRWSDEADIVFHALKKALMSAPLLHLPDFNNNVIVECDASSSGFGVSLNQGDGPIAFFSRAVAAHHAKLPT